MQSSDHLQTLSKALFKLQLDGSFCDFTIECSGGSIAIHGCVAAASSEYFQALMLTPMKERSSKTVKLSVPVNIMKRIVEFFYTGKIEVNDSNLQEIFRIAHRFQIETLTRVCCQAFGMYLSPANVLELLQLADDYFLPDLRDIVLRYFSKHIVEILRQPSLLSEFSFELMKSLLTRDDLVVPNENFVLDFLTNWFSHDQDARAAQSLNLSQLIRFPHLTLDYISRLETVFQPIPEMREVDEHERWNLDSPLYRRRMYSSSHCHLLWQREDENCLRQLVLSCTDFLGTDRIILEGNVSNRTPKIYQCAVSGQTFFSCDDFTKASIVNFSTKSETTFIPFDFFDFSAPSAGFELEYHDTLYIRSLTTKDGYLYVLIIDNNTSRIFKMTDPGEFRFICALEDAPCQDLTVVEPVGYIAGLGLFATNLETGEYVEIREDPSSTRSNDLDWSFCVSIVRRHNTLYLYHKAHEEERNDVLKTFNLTTQEWGYAIERGDAFCITRHVQLYNISEQVFCTMRDTPSELNEIVVVKRLNEEQRAWEFIQTFQYPSSRFVGLAPTDTYPCDRCTWLSEKCRLFVETPHLNAQGVSLDVLRHLNQ